MGTRQRQFPPTGSCILSGACWSVGLGLSKTVGFESVSSRNNHDGQKRHCGDHTRRSAIEDTRCKSFTTNEFEINSGSRRKSMRVRGPLGLQLAGNWTHQRLQFKLGINCGSRRKGRTRAQGPMGLQLAGNWTDHNLQFATIAGVCPECLDVHS